MSRMLRLSEAEFLARTQAGVRGAPAAGMAARSAPCVPGEAESGTTRSAASGVDSPVAGAEAGFLMLPYPVSANRYWRNFGGRMVVSQEATAYKVRVGRILCMTGRRRIESAPVAVALRLHPRSTKTGAASKARMDLDNAIKVALDALNGIAWLDDRQVVKLTCEIAGPMDGGGLSVKINEVSGWA